MCIWLPLMHKRHGQLTITLLFVSPILLLMHPVVPIRKIYPLGDLSQVLNLGNSICLFGGFGLVGMKKGIVVSRQCYTEILR